MEGSFDLLMIVHPKSLAFPFNLFLLECSNDEKNDRKILIGRRAVVLA